MSDPRQAKRQRTESTDDNRKRSSGSNPEEVEESKFQGTVAVVCASNQNRSMAAHKLLVESGYGNNTWSYGTGSAVRLPGPTASQPNIYKFGTPYRTMFEDLQRKDPDLYTRNGLLQMLQRNLSVKVAPQRWQMEHDRHFDLVICYETRVYDTLVDDVSQRVPVFFRPMHIVGMHVKDNAVEAERGAHDTIVLMTELGKHEDWEDNLESVLVQVSKRTGKMILHTVLFV